MPKISQKNKDKISEQILFHLFQISPESIFTNKIALEIARDEEFIKILLADLKQKGLILEINKNSQGVDYVRRQRWRLSAQAYDAYKNKQPISVQKEIKTENTPSFQHQIPINQKLETPQPSQQKNIPTYIN